MAEKLVAGTETQNGLVAESDLMYEAPDNSPEWSLKDAEQAFIDSLVNGSEFEHPADKTEPKDEAEFTYEEPAEDEIPGDDTESNIALATDDDTESEGEEEDPKFARGIQRVVQRELAAKQREEAADKKIAELKLMQAEAAKYGDLKSIKNLSEMLDMDPVGAFKALGKDPETMIKLALAQQMGDEAPEKLKTFAKDAATKRQIAELKAQISQQEQARASQEYFNTLLAGAREHVNKSVGDSKFAKAFPTLTTVAKADPDYARDELMEEIVSEAKRQAATNPDGEPISYTEAAKRVETRIARLAKLLNVQNGPSAVKDMNGKKPVTPPTTKPAAKPLMPWQKRTSNLEEDGLREALKEFERVEAERKQNRLR